MKTYKNLYSSFLTNENFIEAVRNSSKGTKKKKRYDVRRALENPTKFKDKVFEIIHNYKPIHHKPKTIYDGISRKKRTIIVPSYTEQVIQHMVVNTLKPMFLRGIYDFAYGSVPKRGAHDGKKHLEKWIRNDRKNCKYVLKLDIQKYFESIPHGILKAKLERELKDDQLRDLLFRIIDSTDNGLPLGFYTSQWLAMWYLKDFDHYVKEVCHAPHYMRYMDDMVILCGNKRELWRIYKMITDYLYGLGLALNRKSKLFRFNYRYNGKEKGGDIDFMGFRFYRNRTTMRRSTYYKMLRKARQIGRKKKPTIYGLRQMLTYLGYIQTCDVYGVYLKYIKPHFNIKKAKLRISNYDRRRQSECSNGIGVNQLRSPTW